jgi:hypothetical protein
MLEFFPRKGDGAGAIEMGEVSSARGTFLRECGRPAPCSIKYQQPELHLARRSESTDHHHDSISSTSEQIHAKEKRNWGHCVLERDEGKREIVLRFLNLLTQRVIRASFAKIFPPMTHFNRCATD